VGAWGSGSFENDDAADWLAKLDAVAPADLTRIFLRAADNPEYLEAPEASITVAAAEVLASPSINVVPAIVDWRAKHEHAINSELKALAIRALDRVRTNSEVKDLWLEADGLNDWTAAIRELQERLAN
jgi:hypothetical protein